MSFDVYKLIPINQLTTPKPINSLTHKPTNSPAGGTCLLLSTLNFQLSTLAPLAQKKVPSKFAYFKNL